MAGPLLLGVDSGGSKTRACLVQRHEGELQRLGDGSSGPGNILSAPDQAMSNVREAIELAFQQAALKFRAVDSACLCIAGVARTQVRRAWQAWLSEHSLAHRVLLEDDAAPILRAGCPSGKGIALVAGTGSIAVSNLQEPKLRLGGWGPWFSDQGSGYWIARELFRAASEHEDEIDQCPTLHQRVLEHLGVQRFTDIMPLLQAKSRDELASYALLVGQLAEQGDESAIAILERASRALADMVVLLCRRLGPPEEPRDLALAGGLLCNCEILRKRLLTELQQKDLQFHSVQLIQEPVWGAVLMAADSV